MKLTPLGAKVAMLDKKDRAVHAAKILKGENINKYTTGICYETAAYVRFLLGDKIKADELDSGTSSSWEQKLAFKSGQQWDGKAAIPTGYAVGFLRMRDNKFFHAAISTGGTKIRAVNGLLLGAGWNEVDLKQVLKQPDAQKEFDYDGGKIKVYVSKV